MSQLNACCQFEVRMWSLILIKALSFSYVRFTNDLIQTSIKCLSHAIWYEFGESFDSFKVSPDKSCEDLFVKLVLHIRHSIPAIFFPRFILYTFFTFLLIYGGLGVGVLGFWGWSFQLIRFWDCGVGLSMFFGAGALYINIEEQPRDKNYASIPAQFVRHGVYHVYMSRELTVHRCRNDNKIIKKW